ALNGNLSKFDRALTRICAKHVSRGVQKEHYPVVLNAFVPLHRVDLYYEKDPASCLELIHFAY
ncbi:MAG: hypothetical protein AAGD96_35315, partial [Chloroflexota bacterium]